MPNKTPSLNTFSILRLRAGLSQVEAAKALGKAQSMITSWETGKTFPHALLLVKVAKIYNCSIEDLLGLNPITIQPEQLNGGVGNG